MWFALFLAAGAGLSTTIGSVLGVVIQKPGPTFLAFALGFSAGVMIFVSFAELLAHAIEIEGVGFLGAYIAFFLGMGAYFLIDVFVPHDYMGYHDHAAHTQVGAPGRSPQNLERTGLLLALGVSIHNFPEGMATFVATLENLNLGLPIAVAVAIHNIPEGLAIATPIYTATGDRRKAFFWSFFSGISEVAGAVLAAAILMPILSETLMGFTLAAVAGIMVLISLDELIPSAKALAREHTPILGVIVGMILMMVSQYWLE
jgi:zinc transporter, ZIP family